jgi:hypothetical protein
MFGKTWQTNSILGNVRRRGSAAIPGSKAGAYLRRQILTQIKMPILMQVSV